jgi:hypothetical protein
VYLFSRSIRLSGVKGQEAIAWATRLTEVVKNLSGLDVGLWHTLYSGEVGKLNWATFVPDMAVLEGAFAKLDADAGMNELAEQGDEYVIQGTLSDVIDKVVHGQPDPSRRVNYVSAVATTIKAGKFARGYSLGVEIAQTAEKITGLPSLFVANSTGDYAGVAWISGFTDIAELERAQNALDESQAFVELLDSEIPGVYNDQPGAAPRTLYRRIA